MNTILFVDDEIRMLDLLSMHFSQNYRVLTSKNGVEALEITHKMNVDLIVSDIKMPKMDGMQLLKEIKSTVDVPVIIVTAFGSIDNAVDAMKIGAFDYVTKPINIEDLEMKIKRAIDYAQIKNENTALKEKIKKQSGLITEDDRMKEIIKSIPEYATADLPVLILGESGTGKELIARAIHDQSKRYLTPFIAVNVSAVPSELFESEFFGYERGAFTGATSKKIGKFEAASGGTLFLDEIGDMPVEHQSKLLRVLQDSKITRLGSVEEVNVDFRLICATNKPLKEMIEKKTFREDLYYRINVIKIEIPPLRERIADIETLSIYYVQKYADQFKQNLKGISTDAMKVLKAYKWPGNVRELQNMILRSVFNSKSDVIKIQDLPEEIKIRTEAVDYKMLLVKKHVERDRIYFQLEKEFVNSLLARANGNVSKAAEIAGMDRRLLQNIIKKVSGGGEKK